MDEVIDFAGPLVDHSMLIGWRLPLWAPQQQGCRCVERLLGKPVFLIAGYMSALYLCVWGQYPGLSGALGGRGPGLRVDSYCWEKEGISDQKGSLKPFFA